MNDYVSFIVDNSDCDGAGLAALLSIFSLETDTDKDAKVKRLVGYLIVIGLGSMSGMLIYNWDIPFWQAAQPKPSLQELINGRDNVSWLHPEFISDGGLDAEDAKTKFIWIFGVEPDLVAQQIGVYKNIHWNGAIVEYRGAILEFRDVAGGSHFHLLYYPDIGDVSNSERSDGWCIKKISDLRELVTYFKQISEQ